MIVATQGTDIHPGVVATRCPVSGPWTMARIADGAVGTDPLSTIREVDRYLD